MSNVLMKQSFRAKKTGPKNTSLNLALPSSLLNSSFGVTQIRQILLTLGINPGSYKGLMNLTHRVGTLVKNLADQNMALERKKLSYMPGIALSVDAIYNNRSSYMKSPYQPGTQMIYTSIGHDTSGLIKNPKYSMALSSTNYAISEINRRSMERLHPAPTTPIAQQTLQSLHLYQMKDD